MDPVFWQIEYESGLVTHVHVDDQGMSMAKVIEYNTGGNWTRQVPTSRTPYITRILWERDGQKPFSQEAILSAVGHSRKKKGL